MQKLTQTLCLTTHRSWWKASQNTPVCNIVPLLSAPNNISSLLCLSSTSPVQRAYIQLRNCWTSLWSQSSICHLCIYLHIYRYWPSQFQNIIQSSHHLVKMCHINDSIVIILDRGGRLPHNAKVDNLCVTISDNNVCAGKQNVNCRHNKFSSLVLCTFNFLCNWNF